MHLREQWRLAAGDAILDQRIQQWADREGIEIDIESGTYRDPDGEWMGTVLGWNSGHAIHIRYDHSAPPEEINATALHELCHSVQVSHGQIDEGGRSTIEYEQGAWDLAKQLAAQLGIAWTSHMDVIARQSVNTYIDAYNRRVKKNPIPRA